jgi:predicted TIM-barrel fold metal-dependent hydrolase
MVVEWNTHIFSPDRERYPFHPQAAYTPDVSGAPADPLLAYLARMESQGIDRAVLVHPEPYGDDHRLILKLSGLGHFAPDPPLYQSARPFTRRVIQAFGPDRLVWGSGTPEIVDAHMDSYREADRMKVKGNNLVHLLGFG